MINAPHLGIEEKKLKEKKKFKIDLKNIFKRYILEIILIILTIVTSLSFLFYYFSIHALVLYDDAAAHLNISRRVVDSLTPGLVQLGSVWLPLLHILELPFISNDFLYNTALAGSIISILAFLFTSLGIYKITYIVTKNRFVCFIAVLVYISNANMDYMQTAPMFEPLLIVMETWSTYFLLKWSNSESIPDLLTAAFFIFLSSLTRYDGWALCVGGIVEVFLISFIKRSNFLEEEHTLLEVIQRYTKKKFKDVKELYDRYYKLAEGRTVMFASLAALGIVLWFVYNKIIFGSFTYFSNGEFSAFTQQITWEKLGRQPAKSNIVISFVTYLYAVIYNNGLIITIIGFIGLIFLLYSKKKAVNKIAILTLVIPFLFNVLSLFKGDSIIWVPELPPHVPSLFNIRYGLLMLPGLAIFIGYLSTFKKWIKYIIIPLILFQAFFFYYANNHTFTYRNIATMRDTTGGRGQAVIDAGHWIGANCTDGLTLISSASNDSVIYDAHIHLNHFITEGTGKYWKNSLITPSKFAECIAFGGGYSDQISNKIPSNSDFIKHYRLIKEYGNLKVYKIDSGIPLYYSSINHS